MRKVSRNRDALLVMCVMLGLLVLPAGHAFSGSPESANVQQEAAARLYPAVANGKCGYADRSGRFVIPPIFDAGQEFSEGLAPVLVGVKWGYIDAAGKMVIEPQYTEAGRLAEGLAPVRKGMVWGFINRDGRIVVEPRFGAVLPFREGLAGVRDGKWGFIDRTGAPVVPLRFIQVSSFSGGLARVKAVVPPLPGGGGAGQGGSQEAYGFIDSKGNMQVKPAFFYVDEEFREGLAPAKSGSRYSSLFGYVDYNGCWAIEPRFRHAGPFHAGRAVVNIDGKEGFIDRKGAVIITPEFTAAMPFSEGLAAVYVGGRREEFSGFLNDGKWGFIDEQGRIVIGPRFAAVWPFREGSAAVGVRDAGGDLKFGFVTRDGKWALEPTYDDVLRVFDNGLALVLTNRAYCYIDKSGRALFEAWLQHE